MRSVSDSRCSLLAVLLLISALFAQCAAAQEPRPKIGALIPLTGGYSPHGNLVFRGMQMGAGDAFDWVVEDIGTMNARDSQSAAHKILAFDGIVAATAFGIDDAEWVAPLFNRKKTPLVVAWDSGPRIEELGPYVFSAGYETESGARGGARYLAGEAKATSAAVIAEDSAYNRIAVKAFISEAERLGMRILFEDWHNLGEKNFTNSLLRLKAKGAAAAYFIPSLPESFDAGLKQMEVLRLRVPFVSNELIVPDPSIARPNPSGCGNWIPDAGVAELTARYKERFGEEPWNHGPLVVGYEAGRLLKETLAGSKNAAASHAALVEKLGRKRRLDKQFAIWCWEKGKLVRKL